MNPRMESSSATVGLESGLSNVRLDESDGASVSSRSDENGNGNGVLPKRDSFQHVPIVGYEIMEERARFTIYKLRVEDPRTGLSWMVFRRYTDFVRLHARLRERHPRLDLALPPKRRFKDNFDASFLDERTRRLQALVNGVVKNLASDPLVRDFFCLDEPPPVCDSEPESLALFGALEDTVGSLKNQLRQRDETIDYLKKKITYFEDKMRACPNCNLGYAVKSVDSYKGRPGGGADSGSSSYS